jgi:phospholipid-binding lipoprotein MlaA
LSTRRPFHLLLSILLLALAGGCATTQAPDPLEPLNRKVFALNEGIDKVVLKPAATAYTAVVPGPVRGGVSNFFANSQDLWSAANLLLQGQGAEGAREVARFGTNSVVGVFGVFDVATRFGLDRYGETFGSTLEAWGIAPGAYIVWPLFGPSTARDSIGIPVDILANPLTWISIVPLRNEITIGRFVDQRAKALPLTKMIDDVALDKYLYVRDAYLQRHDRRVRDDESGIGADGADPGVGSPLPAK